MLPELNWRKFFKIFSALIFIYLLLMAGKVFAGDLPSRINCQESTPVIDGIISANEWPEKSTVRLSRAFHDKLGIILYFSHDQNYLYLGAYVEDSDLWADGGGSGAGEYWEDYDDDSIEWYFDPNNSRDNYLMSDDRFLALNIGNLTDPQNGSGTVSRRSFNKGLGNGSSEGVDYPGVMPSGLTYKVHHYGTVNDSSDSDTGYSIEVAIPWAAILRNPAAEGDWMGINVIVISDDTGGTRDWSDNRNISPASLRFTTPIRNDEYVELRCSSLHSSQSGLNGPSAYQVLQFHESNDTTAPGTPGSLTSSNLRPYSIELQWTTTGDNGTQGDCDGFEIAYSTSSITESNLSSALKWPALISPPWSGGTAVTKVMGLTPDTEYYFAVRAYDEAGNKGAISTIGPVRTATVAAVQTGISTEKYKGSVQLAPSGHYFMKENGENYIPVGHHFLLQDAAIRYLYSGMVWTGSVLHDYSAETGASATVSAYLDKLAASGVTAMRLFLEDFSLNVSGDGNFNETNGAYWLEFPRNTYNQDMGDFLIDLLKLCGERGIYVLISPFDTYYYDDYFSRTAWAQANGGPLTGINDFFGSSEALSMCKARWAWVINLIKQNGVGDAVLGYEILNEWDSTEWTKAAADANADAVIRVAFIESLAQYIRTLDGDHLIISSTTALDPRGALADFIFYSDVFDATLPHLYFPGNREPWNNPATYMDTAVVREQSRAISWWTTNQLSRRPILDGEWGPSDGWMPDPANPAYFSSFEEADDELITAKLWFTELAGGAAGPGIRMQGGVRAFSYGLHLSDTMLGVQKTISAFVENGSMEPIFDFTDFDSVFWRSNISISGTSADLKISGCSDGAKGLIYFNQDRNVSTSTISGVTLNIGGLTAGSGKMVAEFWQPRADQSSPAHVVKGTIADNSVSFSIPDFSTDWAVRFYPLRSESSYLAIEPAQVVNENDSVTFTAKGSEVNGYSSLYYRFDLIPSYGTASYDPINNWSIMCDFSSSNSCSYTFSQAGDYIVVGWASPTADFSQSVTQIIGGSVSVNGTGGSNCIQIAGLDINNGKTAHVGDMVMFTADAVSDCGATLYYRFDIIPSYGTAEYDPVNNWQMIQDFSTSDSCSYSFSEAGNYVVVVWVSSSLSIADGAAPIFGGSIKIEAR